jgi:light-regulated signal transduction histidine kinase (bacteriophytochrome)
MTVPVCASGKPAGVIQCESHSPRKPNLELHAAVELFAQMLALRLEVDRRRNA